MPPQASGYVKSRLRSLHGALSTGRGAPRQAETKPQPTAQPSVASYEQLPTDGRKRVVVVGLSMVGWKFIDKLVNLDRDSKKYEIVTFSEEPHVAYNRVGLTQLFEHENAEELHMAPPTWYEEAGVRVLLGHKAVRIDRDKRQVLSDNGAVVAYDELVLSTGSEPFVPPIPGADREGVSTYRDIKDVHSIVAQSKTCKSGAVIGGGLLGLESAKALYDLGVSDITIVEGAPRLMVRQLDEQGAKLLQKKVSELNIKTIVGGMTDEFYGDETGALAGMKLKDGTDIPAQMIIVCTGVKPRDELARECGLEVGERGGIVVDDRLQTADPHIYAIGEVACHRGMCYGLVAPGNVMADNLAANLTGGSELFIKGDMSAKLKLLGVDVASFGDYEAGEDVATPFVYADPFTDVYKKLLFSKDGTKLLGGILVGDTADYAKLASLATSGDPLISPPDELATGKSSVPGGGADDLPDSAQICSCNNISKGEVVLAMLEGGATTVKEITAQTKAGSSCGGCVPLITDIFNGEMARAGVELNNYVCEHFDFSRAELCSVVKAKEIRTFEELMLDCGNGGQGCEVCKPTVGGIFAQLWNAPVHQPAHRTLQDTNDRFLANIQRGGSYSVVPRIPGGEITPDKLRVMCDVAIEYGLYMKITGAQRIDMFGAAVHDLPDIWEKLVNAGYESGHAYAKALRAVKSCVGSTWCRYGMQDSVGFAVRLEERYRGIRFPHKTKGAVSGCTRECAEAQGKDFGAIAVEGGYNIFVGGNGGARPRHAELLGGPWDEATCFKYLDRYLMYYVLTADKLQRTAPWQEKHEGGIDGIRQIVIDDKLGICAELETRMQYMVNTYECEWKQVVQDPVRRASFKQFVNTDKVEPGIEFVTERGQQRPADWPKAGTGAPWKVKHVNIGYDGIDDGKPHTAMIEIQHANGGAGSQMNMPTSWVQVGAAADFPQDGGAAILHGRSQIAVFNFTSRGEWYASQNFSPKHRTFAMSRGIIGDKAGVPKVADPVAKTNFALTTGECLSGEDMHLLTFRARAEGGMVYVELPPAEMLDMLLNTSDNEIKVDSRITAEMAAMSSGGGVQASGASGTSCGCGSGGKPGGGGGRLDW